MMSKPGLGKCKEYSLQNEGSELMIGRFSKECGAIWSPVKSSVSCMPLGYVSGTYHSTPLKW